jgi:hypothetical protein
MSLRFLRSEMGERNAGEILLTLARRNVYKATKLNTSLDPHKLGSQLEVRHCYI